MTDKDIDRLYELIRELDYDIYYKMYACDQINAYKHLIKMRDGGRIILDSYHETFCECDENGHAQITVADEGETFSSNLCRIMRDRRMTPVVLADTIDVSMRTMNYYMEGKRLPGYVKLIRLARALKCSVTDLTLPH